ncbi:MAG: hypothetical protein AB199_01990 [Parcubacteria bacterium C7867-004]|nr:MAG: hypothetical protein AB199_01990 [Parcubacteria bacterium C7867-004]
MAVRLRLSLILALLPVLFAVGMFFVSAQASYAATTYGFSTYGSGLYGGLEPPDTTAPLISSISSGTPGHTSVTILWTTDEAATSTVNYGLTTGYGTASTSSTLVTSHSITITGLTPSTTYNFNVGSQDAAGNVATSSNQTFVTAAAPDTTGPVISLISSGTPSDTSATVTWTTNEAADSQLAYGTTASYGATTTLDATLVTSHSVGLTGLTAATTYHFRIRTADGSGNATFSSDQTFTTNAAPDVTAPSATVTAPSNGANLSGDVSVTATASDNIEVAGVSFFIDGERIGSEDTDGTYGVTLDTEMVANSSHTIVASARDTSNNYGTSSAITVTVDNGEEVVDEDEDDDGDSRPGRRRPPPSPEPDSASTGSGDSSSSAVTNLIIANRALFVSAESAGVTLPAFIRQILGLGGSQGSSSSFYRDLTLGSTGEDVRQLQRYLNGHGYPVAATGAGSPGLETTVFGYATQAAVAKLQSTNGILPSVGYFGIKTRAFVSTHP